jgi:hypothetical protein
MVMQKVDTHWLLLILKIRVPEIFRRKAENMFWNKIRQEAYMEILLKTLVRVIQKKTTRLVPWVIIL